MKHPMLLLVGCEEFQTPELERALQLKGWDSKWVYGANGSGPNEEDGEGPEPTILVASASRLDASIQLIRDFRSKNSFIPLILIGENAFGFPVNVDAFIPRGAPPDDWLAAFKPYWPYTTPPKEQMPEMSEVFGKYRLTRKIASGGSADIYQAEQLVPEGFRRVLAIKRLLPRHQQNPSYIMMMLDEANLAAQLNHQNIVKVFDIGSESGAYYLAMEYVDGSNLRGLVNNAKGLGIAFPEPVAAFLLAQAASALDYVHRRRDSGGQAMNLVHRDISPQNILVDQEGAVKIIDFGIAKAAGQEHAQEAAIHGKLRYMSPEQSAGSPTDCRSDIYSLGLVLFEMLTAEHCFQSGDEFGLLEKVRAGMVRDIREARPSTSKPMARILDKALQKNLSNRHRSAQALAKDLAAYLSHFHSASLESDIVIFVKMLQAAQVQAKAFAASRFLPVRGNFALPSEKEREKKAAPKAPQADQGQTWAKMLAPPPWFLPTMDALIILLAILLWVSINI